MQKYPNISPKNLFFSGHFVMLCFVFLHIVALLVKSFFYSAPFAGSMSPRASASAFRCPKGARGGSTLLPSPLWGRGWIAEGFSSAEARQVRGFFPLSTLIRDTTFASRPAIRGLFAARLGEITRPCRPCAHSALQGASVSPALGSRHVSTLYA